ncbi:MAG: tRNA (adenosine(37)-N6)-threonylcarbamoyltransferase complex ATPase subunit type 1 TsaE [Cephaloticoccus sp.]
MASSIFTDLAAGVTTASAEASEAVGRRLAEALAADTVLALHGDLGAGKTTFVRGLARGLGITAPVTSPTFAIYSIHRCNRTLVHLDAYRLESPREVEDLLLEDFLTSPWCLAIEWPEKIADWVPPDALHLEFGITPDERHTIRLREAVTPAG